MAGSRKSLVWNGSAVTERMRRAQIEGINRTMSACVISAKSNHGWDNQTGVLEGSLDITEYARPISGGVSGEWGSRDVAYALIHELGGTIYPKSAKALAIPQDDGSVRLVKSVTIKAQPYLRPAGDKEYPSLARNIRTAYERGGQ